MLSDNDIVLDSILHVCGGDPSKPAVELGFARYSPRMWR